MKRFVSTKLFRSLQKASVNGIEVDAEVLKNGYDEFATLLFPSGISLAERAACHNALVYTRIELSEMSGTLGEKNSRLSSQDHQAARQAD